MKKRLMLYLFAIFILSFSVSAAYKDYYWQDITTHLYLNSDGTVDVVESQTFDFQGPFTFAYRYFHYDEISSVEDIRIFENGREITNKQVYNEKGKKVVKWFFSANNEVRTFTLKYRVTGLVDNGFT